MNENYYSKETIDKYLKKKLCQDDTLLHKYYKEGDHKKFRVRLRNLGYD